MDIEVVKKLVKKFSLRQIEKNAAIEKSEQYYKNENDIVRMKNPIDEKNEDTNNPLRNADNRISHSWYQLLVDQKASYTMTTPPKFDVDDKGLNHDIEKLLGDSYPKVAKKLAISASNAGVAWLHVWKDESIQGDMNGFFNYAVVDSRQIIPIFSKKLQSKLEGLLRVYDDLNEQGESITVYEYWNNEKCVVYMKPQKGELDDLVAYNQFQIIDIATKMPTGNLVNEFEHGWGEVPFIPFRNNEIEQSDLKKIKNQIDVYDKVFSGFVNDLDDIQEIIFVLTNYSGQEKKEFMDDMRKFKMIKLENDGTDDASGVETLAIEIPIEARAKMLEMTREAIFVLGQGVDPQKNIGQNNSGVALKHMYSLLELKASMLETEFREGFATLVRFILRYYGKDPDVVVKQTWSRSSINNDVEKADIVSKLASVTSEENIAKANPIVDNWETELANLAEERLNNYRAEDDYKPDNVDQTSQTEE